MIFINLGILHLENNNPVYFIKEGYDLFVIGYSEDVFYKKEVKEYVNKILEKYKDEYNDVIHVNNVFYCIIGDVRNID